MGKRLTSKDYEHFIERIEEIKFSDIYNETLSFCEEHFKKNPDLCHTLFEILKDDLYIYISADIAQNKIQGKADISVEKVFELAEDTINGLEKLINFQSITATINNPQKEIETINALFEYTFHLLELRFKLVAENESYLGLKSIKLEYFHACLCIINIAIDYHKKQKSVEGKLPFKQLERLYSVCMKFDEENSLDIKDVFERKIKIDHFLEALDDKKKTENSDTENTFNNVPLQIVREIFGHLTTKRNLKNKKSFLTDEQFEKFINHGFLGIESSSKINITYNNDSDNIRLKHLFANFFEFSVKQGYNPESKRLKKEHFVNLFLNNFESHHTPKSFGDHWKKEPPKEKIIWKYEELEED